MPEQPTELSLRLRLSAIWPLVGLLIVAFDLSALYIALGRREFLVNPVWIYLTFYTIAFAFYGYACYRLVPMIPPRWNRLTVAIILLFSVIFRGAVLPARPSLSTDMYRYVWDGRLSNHRINPYRWAPNALTLRSLRDDDWQPMEYKAYQTIYMSVSQVVFAACYRLFGTWLQGYKFVYALFDLSVIALISALLRKLGRSPTEIIWYAWCPLPITEIALAGHQDVVGVFFLMLTFILVMQPRTRPMAAATLIAAGLTKGFAFVLLPVFIRTYGWRFGVIAALTLLYLGMPMWVCLPQFLHGMNQYLQYVHVNSGIFSVLDQLLSAITSKHAFIASKLCNLVILAVIAWSAWRPATEINDLMRRAVIVLVTTLLLVPTLFPWYLVWVLPFVTLLGRRPLYSVILFSGLVVLLYTYYIHMFPLRWVTFVEYLPFYFVAAWEYRRWRRSQANDLSNATDTPPEFVAVSIPISHLKLDA